MEEATETSTTVCETSRKLGDTDTASTSQDRDKSTGKEGASEQRPSTPDANCSICLSKLENKSFTDSCFHQFCFVCLLEWSKVKAVCPLCKQPFKSIIHNVRSLEDYDEYHLRPNNDEMAARARFRYRTTMTPGQSFDRREREVDRRRRNAELHPYSRTTARELYREGRQAFTAEFRRRIYRRNMRVQEVTSNLRSGAIRYRDITTQFFSRNPACTHRLVPWLNRELNALMAHRSENRVQFTLELILELVKRYEIRSEEFRQHLQSLLHPNTEHFIHEFYSFARSPYDMITYDRHAVYIDPINQPVQEVSSDSDRDDIVVDPYPATVDVGAGPSSAPVMIDSSVIVLDSDDDETRTAQPTQRSESPARRERRRRHHTRWESPGDSQHSRGRDAHSHHQGSPASPTTRTLEDLLVNSADTATSSWDDPLPSTSSVWRMPFLHNLFIWQHTFSGAPSFSGRWSGNSRVETIDSAEVSSPGSSHSSDVQVTGVEKPWTERSPIALISSEDEAGPSGPSDRPTTSTNSRRTHKSKSKHKPRSKRERHREEKNGSEPREVSHKKKKYKKSKSNKERDKRKSDREERSNVKLKLVEKENSNERTDSHLRDIKKDADKKKRRRSSSDNEAATTNASRTRSRSPMLSPHRRERRKQRASESHNNQTNQQPPPASRERTTSQTDILSPVSVSSVRSVVSKVSRTSKHSSPSIEHSPGRNFECLSNEHNKRPKRQHRSNSDCNMPESSDSASERRKHKHAHSKSERRCSTNHEHIAEHEHKGTTNQHRSESPTRRLDLFNNELYSAEMSDASNPRRNNVQSDTDSNTIVNLSMQQDVDSTSNIYTAEYSDTQSDAQKTDSNDNIDKTSQSVDVTTHRSGIKHKLLNSQSKDNETSEYEEPATVQRPRRCLEISCDSPSELCDSREVSSDSDSGSYSDADSPRPRKHYKKNPTGHKTSLKSVVSKV